jgi:hypothetical protein
MKGVAKYASSPDMKVVVSITLAGKRPNRRALRRWRGASRRRADGSAVWCFSSAGSPSLELANADLVLLQLHVGR